MSAGALTPAVTMETRLCNGLMVTATFVCDAAGVPASETALMAAADNKVRRYMLDAQYKNEVLSYVIK